MAAFRIRSRLETFWGLQAQLLAGGYLKFYEAGTTTPKDVYGDQALSVNNGAQIALDASGRPEHDCWGDGEYFMEVYDADDVKQGEEDDIEIPGAGGLTIPALENGEFLTNNGLSLLWAAISQLPDMAGQSGKVLGNNGSAALWQTLETPEVPDPEIVVTADSFRAGVSTDTTKWFVQTGAGEFPATGTQSSNDSVTFATTFSAAPRVFLQMEAGSMYLHARVDSKSTTGFTATCDSNIIGENIVSAQPFSWVAIGTKVVP